MVGSTSPGLRYATFDLEIGFSVLWHETEPHTSRTQRMACCIGATASYDGSFLSLAAAAPCISRPKPSGLSAEGSEVWWLSATTDLQNLVLKRAAIEVYPNKTTGFHASPNLLDSDNFRSMLTKRTTNS